MQPQAGQVCVQCSAGFSIPGGNKPAPATTSPAVRAFPVEASPPPRAKPAINLAAVLGFSAPGSGAFALLACVAALAVVIPVVWFLGAIVVTVAGPFFR